MHVTEWQMGHNSRQYPFRTRGASILPARINSCVWHWLFSHFRCQNNKKYIPILRNALVTHECPDLRMSFNCLMGQNRDNKRTLRGKKLPSLLANSASINRHLRSRSAVTYRNRTTSNWGCERQSMISSQFPHIFIQLGAEECVFGSRRKLKVSVKSANFKKCRFCNFSGSYAKRSPSK